MRALPGGLLAMWLVACGGSSPPPETSGASEPMATAAVPDMTASPGAVVPPATTAPSAPTAVASSAQAAAPVGKGPAILALPGSTVRFEGGDGSSKDHLVKIVGARGEQEGVAAEYKYIDALLGKGTWHPAQQSLSAIDGKHVDTVELVDGSGATRTVYFDISDYFGKF